MTGLASIFLFARLRSTEGVVAGHDDVTTLLQFSFPTRPLPNVASAILRDGPLVLGIGVFLFCFCFGLVWFGKHLILYFRLPLALSPISIPRAFLSLLPPSLLCLGPSSALT